MSEPEAVPYDEKLAVTPFSCGDDVCGVAVEGAADLWGAPALGAVIGEALDGGCRRLVVDLSGATFFDSSCLGTLLGAQRRMRNRGGAVAVVCAETHIARIFVLTQLDRVFLLCTDRAEAVARLRARDAGRVPERIAPNAPPVVAALAFEAPGVEADSADEIRLELPAGPQLSTVARLVLGGVASRFELPVDRMVELQFAFEAIAAHKAAGPSVEMIVLAGSDGLRVRAGRFASDPLAEAGTRRAVVPLVEESRSGRDEVGCWVELVVGAARRQGNGRDRA